MCRTFFEEVSTDEETYDNKDDGDEQNEIDHIEERSESSDTERNV